MIWITLYMPTIRLIRRRDKEYRTLPVVCWVFQKTDIRRPISSDGQKLRESLVTWLHPITGSYIYASVSKNTITEISGSVYKALTVKYTDYQILSPLQILLDIGASYSGKGAEYKAFSQSYYIAPDALSYTNLTAIPCYVLNVNDNNLFYDSVTGEFLKMDTQNGGTIYEKEEAFSYLSK